MYNSISGNSVGFGFGDNAGLDFETTGKLFGDLPTTFSGPYCRNDGRFFTASGLVAVCNNALSALVDLANHPIIRGGDEIFDKLSSIDYNASVFNRGCGYNEDVHPYSDKDAVRAYRKDAAKLYYRTLAVIEQLWGSKAVYTSRFEYLHKLGLLTNKLVDDLDGLLFKAPHFEFTEGLEEDGEILNKCNEFIENSTYVYCDEYGNYLGCSFRVEYISATAQYFGSGDGINWAPFPETSDAISEAYSNILNADAYYKIFAFSLDYSNINQILGNKFGSDKYIEIF